MRRDAAAWLGLLALVAAGCAGGSGADGPDPRLPELSKALRDGDAAARVSAANDLARPVAAELVTALGHRDPDVRINAARALDGLAGSDEHALAALRAGLRDEEEGVRTAAALALERGARAQPEIQAALVEATQDAGLPERLLAVESLGRMGTSSERAAAPATSALVGLLSDADPAVRGSTTQRGRGAQGLRPRRPPGCPGSGQGASRSGPLGRPGSRRGPGRGRTRSRRRRSHPDRDASRGRAAPATSGSGSHRGDRAGGKGSGARAHRGSYYKDAEREVRPDAARALAGIGPVAQAAVPVLSEVLRDAISNDSELAAAAARALGRIGPGARDAVPILDTAFRQKGRRQGARGGGGGAAADPLSGGRTIVTQASPGRNQLERRPGPRNAASPLITKKGSSITPCPQPPSGWRHRS